MKVFSSFIVSACGFVKGEKVPDMVMEAIGVNPYSPFRTVFIPSHAFMPAFTVSTEPMIVSVLKEGSLTEVFSSIVERISIAMIALLSWATFKNFSVHPNIGFQLPIISSAHRIKSLEIGLPYRAPVEDGEPLEVRSVYSSDFILRQRNEAVWCIKRLDNFWSWNLVRSTPGAIFHRSSSQGLLKSSRYFNTQSPIFV